MVRADTATAYRNFAAELRPIAPRAHGALRSALTKWAGAGTAVGRCNAENEPRAGYVIGFGPTEKQWDAGRKAAEKVCRHELPDLDQWVPPAIRGCWSQAAARSVAGRRRRWGSRRAGGR